MATILVVDDEMGIRALLSEILSDEGHTVDLAENASQARAHRERMRPDLVLLDIWMPDVDGITLLKEWAAGGQLTMPVVMMSGHGTIDTAVEATKFGATAFLEKPITLQKLLRAVEQAIVKPTQPGRGSLPIQPLSPLPPPVPLSAALPGTAAADGHGRFDDAPFHAEPPAAMTGVPATGLQPNQNFNLERPLREARDAFERRYFEFHLARENGSMTRVAEKTGLERTHLYRKLKQLGVDLSRGKRTPT